MFNVRRPRSTRQHSPDAFPTGCTTSIATLEQKVMLTARSRDSESTLYPRIGPRNAHPTFLSPVRADRHPAVRDRFRRSARLALSPQGSDEGSLGQEHYEICRTGRGIDRRVRARVTGAARTMIPVKGHDTIHY